MIRVIRPIDYESVCAVLQDALIDGGHTTPQRLLEGSNSPHFVGLSLEGTTGIVGAIVGHIVADEAEIHEIGVDRAHRRQGHARALVHAFLNEAKHRGANTCFLEVRTTNTGAVALYRALGFEACGERKGYYQDGANALVLRHAMESRA